jgi:hypothetical protein
VYNQIGHFGEADEIAESVEWLFSERASFCNGLPISCAGARQRIVVTRHSRRRLGYSDATMREPGCLPPASYASDPHQEMKCVSLLSEPLPAQYFAGGFPQDPLLIAFGKLIRES